MASMTKTQRCATAGYDQLAAFKTRTKLAWCTRHLDEILRAGGVEPAEPFTVPPQWRLTISCSCGVRAHYRLDCIVGSNAAGMAG